MIHAKYSVLGITTNYELMNIKRSRYIENKYDCNELLYEHDDEKYITKKRS